MNTARSLPHPWVAHAARPDGHRWPMLSVVLLLALCLYGLGAALLAQPAHADSPPNLSANVPWAAGTGGVADVQAAYNAGRRAEEGQLGLAAGALGNLALPAQAVWDSLSPGERALYLINAERTARANERPGVLGLPLAGMETNLTGVAQTYAQYLIDHNATGHEADGRTPFQRIDDNPALGACHEFLSRAENLTYFWTSGASNPLPIERAIYNWLYNDAGSAWGHREAMLLQDKDLTYRNALYGFKNNVGTAASEGYLGLGIVHSASYNPFNYVWSRMGTVVVFNVLDPISTGSCPWDAAPPTPTPQPTATPVPAARFQDAQPWLSNYAYAPSGGDWTSFDQYPRASADVSGDGRADLVGFGSAGVLVALSTGAGYGSPQLWLNNLGASPAGGGWTSFDKYPRVLGDVNGDGRADAIGFGEAGAWVALSTGTSLQWPQLWLRNFGYSFAGGGWTSFNAYPRAVGDVDGDGKGDLVGFGNAGVWVALSSGASFGAPQLWLANLGCSPAGGGWTSYDAYPRAVADVNGDGRADAIGFGEAGTWVALSTGASFAAPQLWLANLGRSPAGGGWTSYNQYPRTLADVNGDGRADAIGFGGAGTLVAPSTGAGFGAPTLGLANFGSSPAGGGWTSQNTYPRLAAEASGDGRADLVGHGHTATYVAVSDW
ncbi:MAG: hypothetical protein V1772_02155 [Chloroflexota bacterium]